MYKVTFKCIHNPQNPQTLYSELSHHYLEELPSQKELVLWAIAKTNENSKYKFLNWIIELNSILLEFIREDCIHDQYIIKVVWQYLQVEKPRKLETYLTRKRPLLRKLAKEIKQGG